jgi:hypothetical protein
MRLTLLSELARFLSTLEETQAGLLALFTTKRRALDRFEGEELIRLSQEEEQLTARLQALVGARLELLNRAREAGFVAESLLELAGAIGRTVGEARVLAAIGLLKNRIVGCQLRTSKLQHESWIHWIISHRCYNHYTELLELIAHGGHRAPTYGKQGAAGGALLDTAV